MARRGRFGRRRRAGGNLTALIASLVREQRAARDRAIFDAYNNGGTFEGKPVSDKRILSYIRERRDQIGQGDPLWDEWNNRLTQTKFAIGESEVLTRFRQGKASASAVSAFYRRSLDEVPRDSEIWRERARKAADWAKSAASGARAAAGRRAAGGKAAALAKRLGEVEARNAQYDAIVGYVKSLAVREGWIDSSDDLSDVPANELQRIVDGIGSITFNYGKGANGKEVVESIPFNLAEWQKLNETRLRDFDAEIAAKREAGRGVKTLTKDRNKWFQSIFLGVQTIDERSKAIEAKRLFGEQVAEAQGDPFEIARLRNEYVQTLANIANQAQQSKTPEADDFFGEIEAEVAAITEGIVKGNRPGLTGDVSDLKADAADAVKFNEDLSGLQAGTHYYGQASPNTEFGVHPKDPEDLLALPGSQGLRQDQMVAVIEVNGRPTRVVLAGRPISGTAYIDTATGVVVDPKALSRDQFLRGIETGQFRESDSAKVLGYEFAYRDAKGQGQRAWKVRDPLSKQWVVATEDPTLGYQRDASGNLILNAEVQSLPIRTFDSQGRETTTFKTITNLDLPTGPRDAPPILLGEGVSASDLLSANNTVDQSSGLNALGLGPDESARVNRFLNEKLRPKESGYGFNLVPSRELEQYQAVPGVGSVDTVPGVTTNIDLLRRGTGIEPPPGLRPPDSRPRLTPPPAPEVEATATPAIKVPTLALPKPPSGSTIKDLTVFEEQQDIKKPTVVTSTGGGARKLPY